MKRKANLHDLFNQVGGHCFYCDKKMDITRTNTHDAPTRDHFQSKHAGGTNHVHNLVCACHECNSRKGSMSGNLFMAIIRKRHLKVVS
jgi:5-methylcytosine-specific restriction endonuclease McrA